MITLTSILTSAENLLIKNNTTTSSYDISSGLSTRVQTFFKGNRGFARSKSWAKTQYPVVGVEIGSKEEEIRIISQNKRDANLEITIVCVTNYFSGVGNDPKENSDLENIKLSQNIENLIRNFITLSSTVDTLQINNTQYGVDIRENIYNCVSEINLRITLYNR